MRKCGVTSYFFMLRRPREKSTPYIVDLHVNEHSPPERAIWHTRPHVKAFSPAVLFIIATNAHSQMHKVHRTRIYSNATLFVTIKTQCHLKPYCRFIKHSANPGKVHLRLSYSVLCACQSYKSILNSS